jgi:hypothetical protein
VFLALTCGSDVLSFAPPPGFAIKKRGRRLSLAKTIHIFLPVDNK